jgi:hypothetical protein
MADFQDQDRYASTRDHAYSPPIAMTDANAAANQSLRKTVGCKRVFGEGLQFDQQGGGIVLRHFAQRFVRSPREYQVHEFMLSDG